MSAIKNIRHHDERVRVRTVSEDSSARGARQAGTLIADSTGDCHNYVGHNYVCHNYVAITMWDSGLDERLPRQHGNGSYTSTCAQTRIAVLAPTLTHTHVYVPVCTHVRRHVHRHVHIPSRTHARTHARTEEQCE